jgi:hypothetical protein
MHSEFTQYTHDNLLIILDKAKYDATIIRENQLYIIKRGNGWKKKKAVT